MESEEKLKQFESILHSLYKLDLGIKSKSMEFDKDNLLSSMVIKFKNGIELRYFAPDKYDKYWGRDFSLVINYARELITAYNYHYSTRLKPSISETFKYATKDTFEFLKFLKKQVVQEIDYEITRYNEQIQHQGV